MRPLPADDASGVTAPENATGERDLAWAAGPFMRQRRRTNLRNFHPISARGRADGFLVSAKNSGTHWAKFVVSHALASHFDRPPPQRSTGELGYDFIAPARRPRRHPDLPRLVQAHTIPSGLIGQPWLGPLAAIRPTVVLVRDIREAMLSNYVKWRGKYGCSLSEYVRGAPAGKRFIADVWWYVLFFNRWGDIAARNPGRVLVTRYEDLQSDPAREIERIAGHWGIRLSAEDIAAGVAVSGRESVASREDPAFGQVIVPCEKQRSAVAFSAEDEAFLRSVFHRWLRHDFGYGLLADNAERRPLTVAA